MTVKLLSHLRGNAVGYVALFFALGLGTAWALEPNSVESRHIANGEVKTSDVANDSQPGAIRGVDVSNAAGGTLTGSDVDESSLEGVVDNTVVRTTTLPGVTPGTNVGATASCETDEVATGGGIDADASTVDDLIVNSYPSPTTEGATPNGWTANLTWGGTAGTTSVTVYAICAQR